MHNNQSQETLDIIYFARGKHKEENPATSLEIEWAPMAVVKPKDRKDDLRQLFSLSHSSAPVSECVLCVEMRRALLLFIFFRSLYFHSNMLASLNNYLLGPTYLGESNNPSTPHLTMRGTHPPSCQKSMPNTHIWPWEGHIHHHVRKTQHSHPLAW